MAYELKIFAIKLLCLLLATPLMGWVIMRCAESFEKAYKAFANLNAKVNLNPIGSTKKIYISAIYPTVCIDENGRNVWIWNFFYLGCFVGVSTVFGFLAVQIWSTSTSTSAGANPAALLQTTTLQLRAKSSHIDEL